MRKYEYGKLLGRMKECGFTQERLAKAIGIGETSLNLRLNGKLDFKRREMVDICDQLKIPYEQVGDYFFAL